MKIIINSKTLCLPPYISTAWENISSLHVEELDGAKTIIIFLSNSMQVKIPGLDTKLIDAIFTKHAQFLDHESPKQKKQPEQPFESDTLLLNSLKMADMPFDSITNILQHNSEQKNLPDLPKEIMEKFSGIVKMVGAQEIKNLPKAEPHCNCTYCQIYRKLNESILEKSEEEIISDEEFSELI